MTTREFEENAKRNYLIAEIKKLSDSHSEEIMTTEEYIDSIDEMFQKFFMYDTRELYVEGRRFDRNEYNENKEYFILQYVQRNIEVTIKVNLMDLEYFEELIKEK